MRARTAMVGAAAALAVVSACGGSRPAAQPDSDPATATRAPVTVTTTAAAPTTTTVATRTTTNPPVALAGSRCHTPQLKASLQRVTAAAGNDGEVVILTNIGSVTCTVYGYPGIGLLDAGKHLDDLTVRRGRSYLFADPGAHTITLRPGDAASAGFGTNSGATSGTCAALSYLQITPPDETAPLDVAYGGGYRICSSNLEGITALTAGVHAQSP